MPTLLPRFVQALPAILLLTACSPEEGLVIVDLCTPAGASDPFEGGRFVRITSNGDVSSIYDFELGGGLVYEQPAAYPLNSHISLTVEVLNAGDVPIAAGKTEMVKVLPVTRVCACLTLLQAADMQLCSGVGCVYNTSDHMCMFYAAPN